MLTPQELLVCGESYEINGEKILLCSTAEKKIVCFGKKLKKPTCLANRR